MQFFNNYLTHITHVALRYFIIAGIAWLLWYKLFYHKIRHKKIQLKLPVNKDYRREIFYSICTMLVFSTIPVLTLDTPFKQYTQFYSDIHQHSMLWFWLAFPVMFIIHDAYFYWTHRLMHYPPLFPYFHLLHHKSTNPSPWAAYSFHPLEAIVEAGIFLLFLLIMPLTKLHLLFFFLFMIIYNIYGHLGWELYPKKFNTSTVGRWVNTSVNHNQHHQHFKGNYGLYFLWWDRWMGTLRKDYDAKFNEIKSRTKKLKVAHSQLV